MRPVLFPSTGSPAKKVGGVQEAPAHWGLFETVGSGHAGQVAFSSGCVCVCVCVGGGGSHRRGVGDWHQPLSWTRREMSHGELTGPQWSNLGK